MNPEVLNSDMNVRFSFMLECDFTQVAFMWPLVFNVFIIYSLIKKKIKLLF